MSERGAFGRSVALFEASSEVLVKNKVLLLYPAIQFLFVAVVLAPFFGLDPKYANEYLSVGRLTFVPLYVAIMFVFTFLNVAFSHEVMLAFAGDAVSLRRGLAFARSRIKSILMWSLFAGLIGTVIQRLEQSLGFVGRWVLRLVGVMWGVASVFVIQVIVREESTNPLDLLRNSSATVRRHWKDSLTGFVGLGVVSGILFLGVLSLSIAIGVLASIAYPELSLLNVFGLNSNGLIVFSVSFMVLSLATALVIGSLDTVYRCALYVYASEGVLPEPYTADLMDSAWKVKKSAI